MTVKTILSRQTDNFNPTSSLAALAMRYASGQVLFDEHGNGIKCAVFPCDPATKRPYTKHGWQDASTDPAQIIAWWKRWPVAMIGVATGISGLVVIDGDAYKPEFQHRSQHFMRRLQSYGTRQAQTPSGGAHYIFAAGGASWSISNRKFPPSFDVRATGGYIIAAGSVRDDGQAYTWRNNAPVIAVPMLIAHMLDRANCKGTRAAPPKTTPTDYRPKNYQLSQADGGDYVQTVLDAWKPLDVFKRFGLDANGIDQEHGGYRLRGHGGLLIRAGGDEWYSHAEQVGGGTVQAWAWCTRRSLAPRGKEFIAIIDEMAAAAGIAKPEKKDPTPDIAALKLWIKTNSFAPHVNIERYRTDSSDTRVADAILDYIALAPWGVARAGKDTLAKRAGVSANTAKAAVERLAGWLFDVGVDPDSHCMTFRVSDRIAQIDPHVFSGLLHGGQSTQYELDEYTPRKADDVWQSGTSQAVKQKIREAQPGDYWHPLKDGTADRPLDAWWDSVVMQMTPEEWDANRDSVLAEMQRRKDEKPRRPAWYTQLMAMSAGLGETALRIVDAIARAGEMTVDEMATETDKAKGTVGRAARRLRLLGVLEAERETSRHPFVYALAPDWAQTVGVISPALRTHQMADSREHKRLKGAQLWATRQAETAPTAEEREAANNRLSALEVKQAEVLARLNPDVPQDTIKDMAADVPYKQWVQRRANGHIDAKEINRTLMQLAANILAYGDTADKRKIVSDMTMAGYEEAEVWQAMRPTVMSAARAMAMAA